MTPLASLRRFLFIVALACSAPAAVLAGAPAEPPRDPVVVPETTGAIAAPPGKDDDPVALLRELAATGRYDLMVDKWSSVAPQFRIRWARSQLYEGGSLALAAPLVRDLWMAGSTDGVGPDPRLEAVKALLLAYLRLRIDGEYCSDPSGPGDRLADLRAEFRPVLDHARRLGPAAVRAVAMESVILESRTAAMRGPDHFACTRGRLNQRKIVYLDRSLVVPLQARARDAAIDEVMSLARR